MNFFVLPATPGAIPKAVSGTLRSGWIVVMVALGSMLFLTACSIHRKVPVSQPPRVFQYAYKAPARQAVNPEFARKLAKGSKGDHAVLRLNGVSVPVRLGEHYFSANGNQCRRYLVKSSLSKAACLINNRWYQAKPILVNE